MTRNVKGRRVESKVVGGVTMVPASSFMAWADRRAAAGNATPLPTQPMYPSHRAYDSC